MTPCNWDLGCLWVTRGLTRGVTRGGHKGGLQRGCGQLDHGRRIEPEAICNGIFKLPRPFFSLRRLRTRTCGYLVVFGPPSGCGPALGHLNTRSAQGAQGFFKRLSPQAQESSSWRSTGCAREIKVRSSPELSAVSTCRVPFPCFLCAHPACASHRMRRLMDCCFAAP